MRLIAASRVIYDLYAISTTLSRYRDDADRIVEGGRESMVMKANLQAIELAVAKASKNPLNLAWAAGFFDGEGCISLANRSKKPQLRLSVCQVDRRPLDRFYKAVGGLGVVWEPKPGMVSKACYWKTTTNRAMAVLILLWCYLSEPKQEQTLRILEEMNSQENVQVLLSLTR